MAAKSSLVTVLCPNCQATVHHTAWTKISGDDYPELKKTVLNGSCFTAHCASCNAVINITTHVRYSDYSNGNYLIYLAPLSEIAEHRKTIEEIAASFRLNGQNLHVVHTAEDLQNLISAYDAGLKPPVTEIEISAASRSQAASSNRQMADFIQQVKKSGEIPEGFQKKEVLRDTSKVNLKNFFTKSISTNPEPELPVVEATIIEKKFGRHYLVSTICTDPEDESVNTLRRFVTQVFRCDENGFVRSFSNPLFQLECDELRIAKFCHSRAVTRFVNSYF